MRKCRYGAVVDATLLDEPKLGAVKVQRSDLYMLEISKYR